jgi:hypothetical protein
MIENTRITSGKSSNAIHTGIKGKPAHGLFFHFTCLLLGMATGRPFR